MNVRIDEESESTFYPEGAVLSVDSIVPSRQFLDGRCGVIPKARVFLPRDEGSPDDLRLQLWVCDG